MSSQPDDMSQWFDVISRSGDKRREAQKQFMEKLGNPHFTRMDGGVELGYWSAPGGVYRAEKGPNGWRHDTLWFVSDIEIGVLTEVTLIPHRI